MVGKPLSIVQLLSLVRKEGTYEKRIGMSQILDMWDFDKWMKMEEDFLIEDDPECSYVDSFIDFMDRKCKAQHLLYEICKNAEGIKV